VPSAWAALDAVLDGFPGKLSEDQVRFAKFALSHGSSGVHILVDMTLPHAVSAHCVERSVRCNGHWARDVHYVMLNGITANQPFRCFGRFVGEYCNPFALRTEMRLPCLQLQLHSSQRAQSS
jgi:hypothetical protein